MRRNKDNGSSKVDDGFKAILKPILLLAFTLFIDLLGFGIILPNLPQYVEADPWVGDDHARGALIGSWLGASYSVTQFIFAPIWGRYSDKAGRRPVILISLIGVAFAYMLFGLSSGRLWMLFAARILAGVLSSASIGVSFAYVGDVTTPQNRAKAMGILGVCFGLGFAVGPVFGGILGKSNIAIPAYVAAAMSLINFIFAVKMLPESLSEDARRKLAATVRESGLALIRRVMKDPAAPLFIINFVMVFGFAAIEQIFGYFLMARGIASRDNQSMRLAYIMGFVGLAGIVVQGGLIGPVVKRFGEGMVVRIGLAILALGYVLLLFPTKWGAGIVIASMVMSAGRSLISPATTALISRKTQVGQGLIQSTSASFEALARATGPLVAGFLFSTIGPTAPYTTSAGLTVVALILTFMIAGSVALPKDESSSSAA
ncbi:MAG: Permease of the major facilitator superfamily [Armatimonadota bacterium]